MHLIATGEFHDSLVTVNKALHGSIPDVQVGQLVGLLDLVAMCVEQLERGSVEWRREGSVGSLPASGSEPSQIAVIDSQMMYCGGSQVGHSRDCCSAFPSIEETLARIHDTDPIRTDTGFPDEPRGDVGAMDATANDQPVQSHAGRPSRVRSWVSHAFVDIGFSGWIMTCSHSLNDNWLSIVFPIQSTIKCLRVEGLELMDTIEGFPLYAALQEPRSSP